MSRVHEKYVRIFGAKPTPHPSVEFVTNSGLKVILKWENREYRAYSKSKDGSLTEMRLGSISSDNLKNYIVRTF